MKAAHILRKPQSSLEEAVYFEDCFQLFLILVKLHSQRFQHFLNTMYLLTQN